MTDGTPSPFNSALETGVRSLTILMSCYPRALDLGRIVQYDYLAVHSADADGPPSLHPPLPLRSGELLVRRGLVETGLHLMMSRSLVNRQIHDQGFLYSADDSAASYLGNMKSSYIVELRDRADWVTETFGRLTAEALDAIVTRLFKTWTIEFESAQAGLPAEPR